MPPKPSSSAIAVAATLGSVGATAQTPPAGDPPRRELPPPPDVAPRPPPLEGPMPTEGAERGPQSGLEGPAEDVQPGVLLPDRAVEAFAFAGADVSLMTSYLYLLPRIAPGFGAGLRINPSAPHSFQAELSVDFLGGTLPYFYGGLIYTQAVTYLSLPLLARHRISETANKTKHIAWGVQLSQNIGESYNYSLFGVPIYVDGGYSEFSARLLSISVGYQARRLTKRGGLHEFEMRFNLGVTNFGESDDFKVSSFNFRWNWVPRGRK